MLLDAWGNARLGDAGLAVEMEPDHTHVTGTDKYAGTQPFRDPFAKERERKPCNDMFSLGVGLYCSDVSFLCQFNYVNSWRSQTIICNHIIVMMPS